MVQIFSALIVATISISVSLAAPAPVDFVEIDAREPVVFTPGRKGPVCDTNCGQLSVAQALKGTKKSKREPIVKTPFGPSASHDGPRLNFVNKLPKTKVARGEESEFDIEARGLEIEIDELD